MRDEAARAVAICWIATLGVLAACGKSSGSAPASLAVAGSSGQVGGDGGLAGSAGANLQGGGGFGGTEQIAGGFGLGGNAGAAGATTVTAVYEAEDAFFIGAAAVATERTGFSGTGYVGGVATAAERVVFAVQLPEARTVDAELAYLNPAANPAKLGVVVNGAAAGEVLLGGTQGFAKAPPSKLPLRAGLNTVAYVVEDQPQAALGIDSLTLSVAGASVAGAFALRGATVPFTTYEAEDGTTNGSPIAADRSYGTLAAEASGRRAVKLEADGAYVEVKLMAPANALVVRYSMPDAPAGGGLDGALDLYVDGTKRQTLALSSKYAWVYGSYPFDNDPAHGSPHRYFDDARALSGDIPAGATVRLQKQAGDAIASYVVDLIDFEQAPPAYAQPPGSLSIADYGAKSGDAADDAPAIQAAIVAAQQQKREVWLPAGDFSLFERLDLSGVTLRGAGPWYTTLHGKNGKGGFNGTGGSIQLLDFALFGDVSYRDDAAFDAGLDGTDGVGSLLQDLWFEHTKVGVWTIGAEGTLIVDCRVRNTFADGINLTNGTKQSSIWHVHVRNTGDDAIALWSTGAANEQDSVRFSTATLPMLANGIAAYGGKDLRIEDDLVADTVTASAGIAISTRSEFKPEPFSGTATVLRSSVLRGGGYEPNWKTAFGALWIYASQSAIGGVHVKDVELADSSYQGLLLSGEHAIDGATFDSVSISGATTFGIEVATSGSGSFQGVSVSGAVSGGASISPTFTASRSVSNSGW